MSEQSRVEAVILDYVDGVADFKFDQAEST